MSAPNGLDAHASDHAPSSGPAGRRFILIGGMPRSGTTLMRAILDTHPDVAMVRPELDYPGQIARGVRVADALTTLKVRTYLEIPDRLLGSAPEAAYRSVLLWHAGQRGRPIAGEKSPLNEFWYDELTRWLQGDQVRFVHLVRNPIEVVASFKHARFRWARGGRLGRSLLDVLATNWVRSAGLGLARQFRDPAGYRLLRYEDLVAEPEAQVAGLCRFLGLEGDPRALLEPSADRYHNNSSFPEETRAAARVAGVIVQPESRAHRLSRRETRRVSAVVGELATALGYDVPRSGRPGPRPYPRNPLAALRPASPPRPDGSAPTGERPPSEP